MKKLEGILEEKSSSGVIVNTLKDTLKVYALLAAVSGGMILAYKAMNYLNDVGFFEYYNFTIPTFQ